LRRPLQPPAGKIAPEPHDIANDFGDRMVVLDRDLLVNLNGCIQRARQLHILDNRNVVCPGDLPDLEGDVVGAATQTGADIPRSYCNANNGWGCVMITDAFGPQSPTKY